ncbi:MAG: alcohol dehydrogenase catalytic domain-containing protein [bacterium]|nr:alcohol dehydrogenase catalytic domain-containing protein [bacterium]
MNNAIAQIFDGPDRPLRFTELPVPERLEPGEVLVRVDLATVCGSDLHTFAGTRTEPMPAILGHEGVGRVVAKGSGREGLAEGTRVTWTIADSCGQCPACTAYGLPQKCDALFKYGHASLDDGCGLNGCYASHILLRAGTHIVPVPNHVTNEMAAPVNCALATMVFTLDVAPGDCRSAIVQGAGMLGLYAVALLKERGAGHVFCVDVDEGRLALVESFGGIAVDGRPDAYPKQRDRILDVAPRGLDLAVEVAGYAPLVAEGVRLLRVGGHYAFVGMVHPDTQLPVTGEDIVRKCLSVKGTHNYRPRDLDEAVAFLSETADRYPFASLVSEPYALDRLPEAIEEAKSRRWPRVAVAP